MFYFWIGLSERQQKTGSMDLKKNGLSMYDELSPKLYAFSIYNTKSKYSVIFNLIWFSILRFISMPPSILQQSVSPPAFTYSKSTMKTSEQFWKAARSQQKRHQNEWYHSVVSTVNFEQISPVVLEFPLIWTSKR